MDYLVAEGWKDSNVLALKKKTHKWVHMCVDSPGDWAAPEETCLKKRSMAPANAHFVTQTGRER